jgi:hypothetical protein
VTSVTFTLILHSVSKIFKQLTMASSTTIQANSSVFCNIQGDQYNYYYGKLSIIIYLLFSRSFFCRRRGNRAPSSPSRDSRVARISQTRFTRASNRDSGVTRVSRTPSAET